MDQMLCELATFYFLQFFTVIFLSSLSVHESLYLMLCFQMSLTLSCFCPEIGMLLFHVTKFLFM